MKNRILIVFIIILFFFSYSKILASELCSSDGYSIMTINGIFNNKEQAILNKDNLKRVLSPTHNNQPLIVDYLYNPTHLAGVGDLLDAVSQGLFDQKSDYDLVEMLNDASQRVMTQKVLLVGHSQGNFYANNFYDKVASQPGGVPSQSIGVYSVATPANRVAGGGRYITSDSDNVIASVVARFINILSPNIHIPLQNGDGNGHAFSEVYLKYQGDKIISDIKYSLNQLQSNDEQVSQDPCISPPAITTFHKIQGVALTSADLIIDKTNKVGVYVADTAYKTGETIGKVIRNTGLSINNVVSKLLANAIDSLPDTSSITTVPTDVSVEPKPEEKKSLEEMPVVIEETPSITQITVDELPIELNEKENTVGASQTTPDVLHSNGGGGDSVVITETVDTIPPVITLNGNAIEVVIKNSVYNDAGATALDNIDGVSVVTTTGIADLNTAVTGTYDVTYTATDSSSNTATTTRKVVVDDGAKLDRPNFVAVSGNYAYVVSDVSNSLEIIDISNPSTLIHKGSIIHNAGGVAIFAPKAVAISGNYAYVVSYSDALEVIDISNPILPVHKSTLYNNDGGALLFHPNFISISGDYAYIVSNGSQSIEIVNISDPSNPTHKGSHHINSLTSPYSVFVSGNYMYLTYINVGQGGGGLQIVDVSDPASPVVKGSIEDGTNEATIDYPVFVFVNNTYAYVASWGGKSLEIIDISDPSNPTHKGKLTSGFGNPTNFTPNFIFVSGNYAYITSHVGETLEVVDISDPSNPIHKKSLATGTGGAALSYPTSIFISNIYAYISSSISNALEIIDISNPINPIHINKISNGEFSNTDPFIPVLSSAKQITAFNFNTLTPEVVGVVGEATHTISLTVPFNTNVTNLVPNILVSSGAVINPADNIAQDFTNPVTYTVTAEDSSTQDYVVTVIISPDSNLPPDPDPDTTPPVISSLTISPSPIFGYAKIGDILTLSITADGAGYTAQAITVNNVATTNFTDNGDGTYTATYTVSQGNNDIMSGTIPASVVLSDANGNLNTAYTTVTANNLKIDANAPTLVSAEAKTSTTIDVTFNEDIDGSTVNTTGSEFTVSGHTVISAHELEGVITLTLSTTLGVGETPNVTFTSTNFKDLAGNQAINPATVVLINNIP